MKAPGLLTSALLATGVAVGLSASPQSSPPESPASQAEATEPKVAPSYPIPDNLVVDLRLFESRSTSPNFSAMRELSFFIMTDGRDVTALQWPTTLAKQIPDTFLAALVSDTVPVEQGVAHFEWSTGTRSIQSEIRIESYHPAGTFEAHLQTRFMRGDEILQEYQRPLELQMHRTSVWSGDELEMTPSDYLSNFREFADRESRGQLYELLRPNTFFLIMAATPRLLTDEEAQRWKTARTLSLPPGAPPPALENPTGIPLKGTIVLSFELDDTGHPINPQIARSSFPEANLHVVEEAMQWQFPTAPDDPRAGRVEIDLDIPATSP